jgi:hypothetical protein
MKFLFVPYGCLKSALLSSECSTGRDLYESTTKLFQFTVLDLKLEILRYNP